MQIRMPPIRKRTGKKVPVRMRQISRQTGTVVSIRMLLFRNLTIKKDPVRMGPLRK